MNSHAATVNEAMA